MKSAVIRQAVLADLDAVTVVFDQYRQFQGKASDLMACRAFLRERFDHGESIIFLAFLGDQPVGMAQMYPSYSSTALARVFVLNDLFVSEFGRRAGVATALLKAVEQYAWSFGACRVSLNVAQSNVTAQDLYRARGWTQDDEFFMFHRFPPKD
jgi:GNAT superfamily N-acetyltransferase